MGRRRTYGIMGGVVLTLALVAVISITYATFTRQLSVGGTGTVKQQSWDVHIKADSLSMSKSATATQVTAPTIKAANGIESTAIGDYNVQFSTPGDYITYTFTVENKGTFNASVASVTVPTPTVTGTGANKTTDETNVKNKLHYTLTYADGTQIKTGDVITAKTGEKSFKLTLSYDTFDDETLLPTNDVTISGLAVAINFTQA